MRILLLTTGLAYGGAARQLTLLAAGLPRERFTVRVFTLGTDSPWARELRDGASRLFRTPRALAPITSITLGQLVQGLVLVVSLVVFRERFKEGVGSFSWLVAAGGLGVGVGLLTVAPLEARLLAPLRSAPDRLRHVNSGLRRERDGFAGSVSLPSAASVFFVFRSTRFLGPIIASSARASPRR